MNNIFSLSEIIIPDEIKETLKGKEYRYEFYLGDKLIKYQNSGTMKSNNICNGIIRKLIVSFGLSESDLPLLNYKAYHYGKYQYCHTFKN